MKTKLNFTAYVKPVPQGSLKAFMRPGARYPVVTSDNTKMKPCRSEITRVAIAAMEGSPIPMANKSKPIELRISFNFHRPKTANKRADHTVKPDLDKLCRMVLDALTGVAYEDDSQVVQIAASKEYCTGPESIDVSVTTL